MNMTRCGWQSWFGFVTAVDAAGVLSFDCHIWDGKDNLPFQTPPSPRFINMMMTDDLSYPLD